MQRQQGYSLLETVFVITIVGILSSTALPKFWQLNQEAKRHTLKQSAKALQQSVDWLHQRAVLRNLNFGLVNMPLDPQTQITLVDGYPLAESRNLASIWQSGLSAINQEKGHRVYFGFQDNLDRLQKSQCYLMVETQWQGQPLQSTAHWRMEMEEKGC